MRKPDFGNLLNVLNKKVPARPTLFDFFLNDKLLGFLSGTDVKGLGRNDRLRVELDAFLRLGYDYLTVQIDGFEFYHNERKQGASASMSAGGCVANAEDLDKYIWPQAENMNTELLEMKWAGGCPDGVRLIVYGPGGILENATDILGYDALCYLIYDEPELIQSVFENIGRRMLNYYQAVVAHENVGAIIYNDDWGYKTQTIVSPDFLRANVFPWVKKIVELAHAHHKPVILHSCGNLDTVYEDIIGMGIDAKQSFEDQILPIEKACERYHGRIALLGGIDMDFICRASVDQIKDRCEKILEKSSIWGGYALGTGNSVPDYVPFENYFAMLESAGVALK